VHGYLANLQGSIPGANQSYERGIIPDCRGLRRRILGSISSPWTKEMPELESKRFLDRLWI
jgi:hypothetical protein